MCIPFFEIHINVVVGDDVVMAVTVVVVVVVVVVAVAVAVAVAGYLLPWV